VRDFRILCGKSHNLIGQGIFHEDQKSHDFDHSTTIKAVNTLLTFSFRLWNAAFVHLQKQIGLDNKITGSKSPAATQYTKTVTRPGILSLDEQTAARV
jgi:hypothetical protein